MIYGYARVSTIKQITGNSLEEQESILTAEGCQHIVIEQYTGKTTDRPKLTELANRLVEGDTLVTSKLDRLARSVTEGSNFIKGLIDRGISVKINNIGTISNKPMDKLMLNVLLAFAEFERDMIIERTQAGKELAKTKEGFRDGRPPKYTKERIQEALRLLQDNSYTKVEKLTGISKSTLIRAKRRAIQHAY
jgi:Site-specific recombinases, DNA invertase Pin homologs